MPMTAKSPPKTGNREILEIMLGGSLRAMRIAKGQRLADVAQATGCAIETICDYEQGRSVPSIRRLAALLDWKADRYLDH